MAFSFASLSGGMFLASKVSDEIYDPVFDTPVDGNLIYPLLPSFYRNQMDDKEVFSTYWSGMMQQVAGDLLHLWHVDYARNLRDVPVISQRKWIQLDLVREIDFTLDPEFSFGGLGATAFSYDQDVDSLVGTWTNRARLDKAYLTLKGDVSQLASLSFSYEVKLTSIETRGAILVGYLGDSDQLRNAFVTAIIGDVVTGNTPTPGLIHFDPLGNPTVGFASFTLSLNVDYRFNFTYTAITGVGVLEVVELLYLRATGTQGETSGELEEVLTNVFVDQTVNFDTLGIQVGDILTTNGSEFEIISVDGSQLTTRVVGLPVEASGLSWEIRGEEIVTSCSLDLPGDATDPSFVCSQFGTCCLDLRYATSQIYSNPGLGNRKTAVAEIRDWQFMDPTFDTRVISIPRLQDVVTNPTMILMEGTDYDVVGSTLHFMEPPPEGLWAEYIGYDEYYIRDNFGKNVDLVDQSSDQYRARVRGLYYAYFQGPTLYAVRQGIHILIGLPIADKAGSVESINLAFSGIYGLITVAGEEYLFPSSVGTDLQVGDVIKTYEPLCKGVEILDYIVSPEWFVDIDFKEIKKFHTFLVRIDLDAFTPDTIQLAEKFVDQIKPTWKDYLFVLFKRLEDQFTVSDSLAFKVTILLEDQPCDDFVVMYDSVDYEGEEADWKYSQGLADWDETSAAMRASSTVLGGTALFTSSVAGVVGTSTTFLADIGGPGPVVDKYVAVGLYLSSPSGETTVGSNILTDLTPGVFTGLEIEDQLTVTGEGTFEVIGINIGTGEVTLDGPMTATNLGVPWSSVGKLKIWGKVATVGTNTALVLTTPFGGSTGNYVVALLDNDYRRVFYDQFQEACPDEELTFVASISPLYVGGLPLNLSLPDSQTTTVALQFTNYSGGGPGDTVQSTVAEPVP